MADRVTTALHALGVRPSSLYLEEVPAGLLFVARIGDRSGACLVPPGFQANYADVAKTLLGETVKDLTPIATHEG